MSDAAAPASPPAAKRAKGSAAPGTREHFLEVYEELRALIVEKIVPSYGLPAEAAAWNRDMLDYNVPGAPAHPPRSCCGAWGVMPRRRARMRVGDARGRRERLPRPSAPAGAWSGWCCGPARKSLQNRRACFLPQRNHAGPRTVTGGSSARVGSRCPRCLRPPLLPVAPRPPRPTAPLGARLAAPPTQAAS